MIAILTLITAILTLMIAILTLITAILTLIATILTLITAIYRSPTPGGRGITLRNMSKMTRSASIYLRLPPFTIIYLHLPPFTSIPGPSPNDRHGSTRPAIP
jgi:hypothetical protein